MAPHIPSRLPAVSNCPYCSERRSGRALHIASACIGALAALLITALLLRP